MPILHISISSQRQQRPTSAYTPSYTLEQLFVDREKSTLLCEDHLDQCDAPLLQALSSILSRLVFSFRHVSVGGEAIEQQQLVVFEPWRFGVPWLKGFFYPCSGDDFVLVKDGLGEFDSTRSRDA